MMSGHAGSAGSLGPVADDDDDLEAMGDGMASRLPGPILAKLSAAERRQLGMALARQKWGRHPVNLRLSVPIMGRRFFLTVVGGVDRRDNRRRALETSLHPVRTRGNYAFLIGISAVVYALGLLALFLFNVTTAG